ncbi:hypothetical protein BH10ACI1_BH10ACI1_11670 [soil metagenome]
MRQTFSLINKLITLMFAVLVVAGTFTIDSIADTSDANSGISGARVLLTDTIGNVREARTSSFGYYRFADVAVGETYVLTATRKGYEFITQIVSVNEEFSDINFVAVNQF